MCERVLPLLLGMYFIRCTQVMQRDTELYNTSRVVSASTLLNESSDGRCAVLFNDVPATSLEISKQRVHLHI